MTGGHKTRQDREAEAENPPLPLLVGGRRHGVGWAGGSYAAIEDHPEATHSDDGSSSLWALRMIMSKTWAPTLDGVAVGPLNVTGEGTHTSARIHAKRFGRDPGHDGIP